MHAICRFQLEFDLTLRKLHVICRFQLESDLINMGYPVRVIKKRKNTVCCCQYHIYIAQISKYLNKPATRTLDLNLFYFLKGRAKMMPSPGNDKIAFISVSALIMKKNGGSWWKSHCTVANSIFDYWQEPAFLLLLYCSSNNLFYYNILSDRK